MEVGVLLDRRFRLLYKAGEGGMGEVYKAVDQENGAPVAIKILPERRLEDTPRFSREARILSELAHPQIVRYVARGELPTGEPYIAMEWLDGEDLSMRLSRGRLTTADSVALVIRVAEALGFAHARGIVHRDLKPSNIFLPGGQIGAAKLLDFGLARFHAASFLTRTGLLMGTPGYMAPEQARGQREIDARSDVFSLGCVLFECLTGEPAYTGMHIVAILTRILFEEPPRLRDKRPELPPTLEALIERMLARDPDARPSDGQAVADALRGLGEMPSSDADVPQEEPVAPKALTSGEQRAVAVILIRAPSEAMAETRDIREAPTVDMGFDEPLRREAAAYGGHFERLLDGAVAVMLDSPAVATDLAAQAARCALALRTRSAAKALALAMGRAATTGRLSMGQAIDRAAKLLEVMPGGDVAPEDAPVVLDEVTAGLLDARFDVRDCEAAFVLHRERGIAEGTRTLLGKATPCVGRDAELRTLEVLFDECLDERAAWVVLVTGPAGAGKSRLAVEFLRYVRQSSVKAAIWHGRTDPLGAGSAFSLLGQCLRRVCGILDGEPLDVRRQKLATRVGERVAGADRKRVTEFLGEIIGAPFPDDERNLPLRAARKDAQLMNDQMRAAFLSFLAAECASGPVLIGLEDLHWGDLPTVQLLDRALQDLHDQPLFVIAMARPEVHDLFPKLWGERNLQEVRLNKLGRRATERLARHVLGEKADQAMIDRLAQLSEGNAFYLEELIRFAAEGRGAELPGTVVAMVQSRLGAFDDDARRILRAASVFGEAFWAGGVTALLGGAERVPRMPERLQELVEREVIVNRPESRFPGEQELAFRHALLREGSYSMLMDEDRGLGHRLAGEWLEQRGEHDMLVLAEHFEKGKDGERAGECYLRAAERALWASDMQGTVAYARRGLACPVPEALRVRLLGTLCQSGLWHVETWQAALPNANELAKTAERGSAPWINAMHIKLLGALRMGSIDELVSLVGLLLETEFSHDAADGLAASFATGAYMLDILKRIPEANALQERFSALLRFTGDREPLVSLLWHAACGGRNSHASKNPWSALEHSRAALRIARSIEHRQFVGMVQMVVGKNCWLLGASEEAEHVLSEIAVPDHELGMISFMRAFCLAWLLLERGWLDNARAWANRIIASGQARYSPFEEAHGRWVLAEVLRRAGELEAADQQMQTALLILGLLSPLEHPGALGTLAALRLAQGRPAEALAAAREGMALAGSTGACSFFFRDAYLHLTHAECLDAAGDRAGARAAIAEARQWILAVADKIGDVAYRKTYLENVPENSRTLELSRQWLGQGA